MKKKTKKKAKTRLVPLGCLRVQVTEEPISPPMEGGPADLRAELECVLNSARQTLNHYGDHPVLVIFYAVSKKFFVILNVRNDQDKISAKTTVKVLAEKYQARAAIFIAEAWVRPRLSISKEDPRREEILIASAKSSSGHFVARQKFLRLTNGQLYFEEAKIRPLDKNSPEYDSWLGHLQF